MNCLINLLVKTASEKGKSLLVIKRYLRIKFHILVSDEVLQQRQSFLQIKVA